jgi:hypothetical protein
MVQNPLRLVQLVGSFARHCGELEHKGPWKFVETKRTDVCVCATHIEAYAYFSVYLMFKS